MGRGDGSTRRSRRAWLSGHIRTPAGGRISPPAFAALDTDKASSLSITTATAVSSLTITGAIAGGNVTSLTLPSLPDPAASRGSAAMLSIEPGLGTTRPRPPAGVSPPIPKAIAYAAVRPNAGGLPNGIQEHYQLESSHTVTYNECLQWLHRASV